MSLSCGRGMPKLALLGCALLAFTFALARGPYAVAKESQCRDRQSFARYGLKELVVLEELFHAEHARFGDADELHFAPRAEVRPLVGAPVRLYRFVVFPHAHGFVGLAYGEGEQEGDVWIVGAGEVPQRLANACVR